MFLFEIRERQLTFLRRFFVELPMPMIKVDSRERIPTAPLDRLYLCPLNVVANALDGVDWPKQTVYIERSACMSNADLLSYHLWSSPSEHRNRLMCIQKTTEVATRAFEAVGVDAFLLAGSLLGWQRHGGGQIPWDTDGDTGISQSQCVTVMKRSDSNATNIAGLVKPHVPEGFELKYFGGKGTTDHPENEFPGCDFKQLRITSVYQKQACFTDIYLVLDEDVGDCHCSTASADSCVRAVPEVCPNKSSLLPVVKAWLNGEVNVNLPHNLTDVLKAFYGKMPAGTDILNLKPVPKNWAFGESHAVVVGELITDSTNHFSLPFTTQVFSELTVGCLLFSILLLLCVGLVLLRRRWHRRNYVSLPYH